MTRSHSAPCVQGMPSCAHLKVELVHEDVLDKGQQAHKDVDGVGDLLSQGVGLLALAQGNEFVHPVAESQPCSNMQR